ncbi:ABC transporter permease [Saccharothrix coeruleofusca]|uniref:Peptide ABC transporter permease n=1 Tax=Saccharothrix coeruleofusca TaxID=33919 RepID=A0A918AN01_9PSEU|nr:ABC transporter permease [Saccharothrix coeruleofusca]MBP2340887.1 peptide/nickel transport system permease protein [Saccharothrix coeruleofusca]GGP60586.1 peptide ABC transporter permease [Saccharothrix coeruleofusca]
MFRYIIRRLLISIPLLIVASFLCFGLTTAMGDPLAEWKLQKPRSEAEIALAYERTGYNQPFLDRYVDWAGDFVTGDWGETVVPGNAGKPVKEELLKAFGVTLRLIVAAELIALLLGMAVGVIGAVRQYSLFDYTATGIAFVMFSMPLFCVALIIKAGGIEFNNWLESIGAGRWLTMAGPPGEGFSGSLGQQIYQYTGAYILPTICLVMIQFALYSRFQRASMLETLNADYVRTAQAKGVSQGRAIFKHAFRNALIPIITVSSLNFGAAFGGAVITETVFGWSGMGKFLVDAVTKLEPYQVLGFMMLTAVFIIVFNLIADVLYAFLDPRIRLD